MHEHPNRHPYRVDIVKLRDGEHSFQFAVDDRLFQERTDALAQGADVTVDLLLRKDPRMIDVRMHLHGELTLMCDRCLGALDWPVDTGARLLYSYDPGVKADPEAEADEDIEYIRRDQQYLDFAQDIYDFLSLQVPLRKVPTEASRHQCPPEVVEILRQGAEAAARQEAQAAGADTLDADPDADPDAEGLDPRWAALRGLRDGGTAD